MVVDIGNVASEVRRADPRNAGTDYGLALLEDGIDFLVDMRVEPIEELGTVRHVDLTISSELDRRVPDPPGIVIAPIAIDFEREQRPQRRDI